VGIPFDNTGMKTLRLLAAALAMSGVLTACASVGGSNKALDTYDLAVPSIEKAGKRNLNVQILVAEPQAVKILDSENIVVRNGPSSLAYLGGAQWSDRLPKLVQARLVQAFENSNRFGGVGRPGEGLAIDYQIITDIRAFEAGQGGDSSVVVEITAKLLNDRNGVVGSSKLFTATAPAGAGSAGIVAALDSAFGQVSGEIIAWAASNT
jgi:cholesterol transport system auxiliary component